MVLTLLLVVHALAFAWAWGLDAGPTPLVLSSR